MMNVRPLLAAALAALLAAPLAASAQARPVDRSRAAAPQSLSIGAWLGYEMGDLDGLALRAEAELPFQALTPEVGLSFVGSFGYSRLNEEFGGFDADVDLVKLVPAARFTMAVSPELSLFGDAGLGLYYYSLDQDLPFGQRFDDDGLGVMLRFGAGAFYQLNPQVRLGGALVFDPMFGDYDDNTVTIQVGVTFAL